MIARLRHFLSLGFALGSLAAAQFVTPLPDVFGPDTGEPSLHRGLDGTTYLTYVGPGRADDERALWLATLAPSATAWSTPRRVVSSPLLMENWADFATLTVATDGTFWAQWFQRRPGEDAHGYDGWFARSTDAGATWTTPAPLGHEFVSLAPLSGGRVLAVWLESTHVHNPNTPHVGHDPAAPHSSREPHVLTAPSMRLAARLLAHDGSTLENWIVDPDVCTCCQTSVASLPDDRVLVTYRGHTPDEIRDNCVALFTGTAWTEPYTLHDDGWKIPGCPVNGPAADAHNKTTAVAWFTAAHGVPRVQAKFSPDGGATFGPPLTVDLGQPIGRVDLVMLADGSAIVSWLESGHDDTAAGLYVRRVFAEGSLSAPQLVAATSSARASGFARMATRPGNDLPVAIAWTEVSPAPADGGKPSTSIRTATFAAATLARTTAPLVAIVHSEGMRYDDIQPVK